MVVAGILGAFAAGLYLLSQPQQSTVISVCNPPPGVGWNTCPPELFDHPDRLQCVLGGATCPPEDLALMCRAFGELPNDDCSTVNTASPLLIDLVVIGAIATLVVSVLLAHRFRRRA